MNHPIKSQNADNFIGHRHMRSRECIVYYNYCGSLKIVLGFFSQYFLVFILISGNVCNLGEKNTTDFVLFMVLLVIIVLFILLHER